MCRRLHKDGLRARLQVGLVGIVAVATVLGAATPPAAAAKRVLTWAVVAGANYEDRYRGIEQLFEASYPDIDLKWVPLDGAQYRQQIITRWAGGSSTDVITTYVEDLADWATAGMLEPIDAYITKTKFDLSPLFPAALAGFTYKDTLYGIPITLNVSGLFYNVGMFDSAGLKAPDDSWTWQDLAVRGGKLTHDANGDGLFEQFGFNRTSDFVQWLPLIYSYGGGVINPVSNQIVFNSKPTQDALQLYVDLSQKYHAAPKPGEGSGFEFQKGHYGMIIMADWVRQIYRNISGFSWDVAPMPAGPKGRVAFIGGSALTISRSSPNKDLAWEFVRFITREEVQKLLVETRAGVPVVQKVAAEHYVGSKPVPPSAINLIMMMKYARWVPGVPRWREMLDVIKGQLPSMLDGSASAAQMTETTAEKLKQLVK